MQQSLVKKRLLAIGLTSAIATSGAFISQYEGLVLGTYVDPVGIVTSCFGHTGKELKPNTKFTEEQCLTQFAEDLVAHDKKMMRWVLVPLTNEERAAYLSLTYNIGVGAFSKSTLLKKLNSNDRVGACNELVKWNKAGGVALKGLTKRRASEKELCLKGAEQRI